MLVTVLVLASLGVGMFVGYKYCTQDAGENTLRDCLNDTAVNVYRTAWGSSDDRSSDGTSTGKEETKTFYSKALDQSIKYEIYLPPATTIPATAPCATRSCTCCLAPPAAPLSG